MKGSAGLEHVLALGQGSDGILRPTRDLNQQGAGDSYASWNTAVTALCAQFMHMYHAPSHSRLPSLYGLMKPLCPQAVGALKLPLADRMESSNVSGRETAAEVVGRGTRPF